VRLDLHDRGLILLSVEFALLFYIDVLALDQRHDVAGRLDLLGAGEGLTEGQLAVFVGRVVVQISVLEDYKAA
jgi:hypothetical protein